MAGSEQPTISLVLTVKNEESSLPAFFASLDAQTVMPKEVILVDGGSTDGTLDVARQWETVLPFIMVSEPGASISRGRNLALQRATGSIIAVTDAGTRLERTWLEQLTEPFERSPQLQPDVVAGFFSADTATSFEFALGATTLPDIDEIHPETFLPSSRSVAFRRSLFEIGIRYPEWLDYCEDLVFDLKLKRAGSHFEFSPGARVAFRPRASIVGFMLQYFRYARGDGKAGLFARRHIARYAAYLVILPLAMRRRDPISIAVVGLGGAVYLRTPIRRLFRRRKSESVAEFTYALALVPVLRFVGDVAKMAGYPVGLWWRWRRYGPSRNWRTIADEISGTETDVLEQ